MQEPTEYNLPIDFTRPPDVPAPVPARSLHPPLPAEVASAPDSERFGRYVRAVRLGEGGMGEVWKAWDIDLGRWVALKLLKGDRDRDVAAFRREAQLAGGLQHPNIAALYEVGEAHGRHFIAMQYIEGRTFGDAPRDDLRALVSMLRDAARAIQHAHERGIVHRDIKPDNFIVADRIHVMDFGLARSDGAARLTRTGEVMGTPYYMSPEQARGERVDARTDVWSLGVTLYEALCGRLPFNGLTAGEILRAIEEQEPPAPGAGRDIDTVALKCLEKNRERRYATAAALADDLDRWLRGEPVAARPASLAYRVWKRLARRKAIVAVVVLSATALSAAVVPRLLADRARARAMPQVELARQQLRRIEGLLREAEPGGARFRSMVADARRMLDDALAACPTLPEAHLELGRLHVLADDSEAALVCFTRAVELAPQSPTAHMELAIVALDKLDNLRHDEDTLDTPEAAGLRATAIRHLEHVRAWSKEAPELLLAQGMFAVADDRKEEAAELFARCVAQSPDDARARLHHGHALMHAGHYPAAVRALEEAVRRGAPHASYLLGCALTYSGEPERALPHFERALALATRPWSILINQAMARAKIAAKLDGDEAAALRRLAIEGIRGYVEQQPHRHYVWGNRARLRKLIGHASGALEDVDRAIALKPRAEWYGLRGQLRADAGDPDGAIADMTRQFELEPSARVLCNRSIIHRGRNDFDRAIQDATEAIARDPKLAFARWTLGDAYQCRGSASSAAGRTAEAEADWRRAIAHYDAAAEINPNDFDYLWTRGATYFFLRDLPRALADINRCIEGGVKNPNVHDWRLRVLHAMGKYTEARDEALAMIARGRDTADVRVRLGEAYFRLEAPDDAMKEFERAIAMNPKHATAHLWVGFVLVRRAPRSPSREETLKRALESLNRSIDLDATDPLAFDTRARAYQMLGRHEAEVADLTRCLALRPDKPYPLCRRALAREKLGQREGARADATAALRMDLTAQERAPMEALLKRLGQ